MPRIIAATLPRFTMPDTDATSPRRHEEGLRFVRRMHLPRTLGLALGGVAIGTVLWTRGAHPLAWAALAASALAWPHVAYALGLRSADPYRSELRSLTLDSALGGAWIAALQFNLLPSVVLLAMLSMDKMAVGGARFLARTSAVLALACLLVAALNGFAVRPYTSFAEMLGTLPLLAAYPMAVGFITYRLARRVRDQNRLLSEISRTDGLTRLLNRRYWEEAVAAEFERCRRAGGRASLLMLDIDHFKAINDRHGHPAGDEVIRKLASILRDTLREQDVPGRYGGEEFGIVLPDTGAAGAEAIAERVRTRIEASTLSASGIRATVSIGIAALDVEDRDYSVWIAHADRALYSAKERGRNRSVRYTAAA
ncbi:MAG TPA: diguanylate cyclase [Burkholderiales bacterium]|nr:diguanylate cyclase [Burkholderiales bacterium]